MSDATPRLLLFTAATLCCLIACQPIRQTALTSQSTSQALSQQDERAPKTPTADLDAILTDAEQGWRDRAEKASLQRAIDAYTRAISIVERDLPDETARTRLITWHVRLSRAHHLLADTHLDIASLTSEVDPREMRRAKRAHYEAGISEAERAIALADPEFAKAVTSEEKRRRKRWAKLIHEVHADASEALAWYAMNLHAWSSLKGMRATMENREVTRITMEYVSERAPRYFYASPARFFASYHAQFPVGSGDPKRSRAYFESSLEFAPNYFATRVLFARTYAVLIQDPRLFEEQLRIVLDTPADIVPELTPENTLEQRKAQALLAQREDLFF